MHDSNPALRPPADRSLARAADPDLESLPYPSVLATDARENARTVMRLSGTPGLISFGGTAHTLTDRENFLLTLAISRFGGFDVSHAHHTPVSLLRSGDNFGHQGRAVRVLIVLDGDVTLSAAGRSLRIGPGGGALLHGWDEYVYESTTEVTRVHVDADVDDSPLTPALQNMPALVWRTDTPVLRAAGAALAAVVRRDERGIGPTSRACLGRLVQSVLLSVLSSPPSGGVPAPARLRNRARVIEHIATRHTDPTLSPATIAANLGMSMRSLQRLFESSDQGVADHITTARLEHALTLLSDPQLAEMTMEEVATRTGFSSVSRMRRVVRAGTGLCPTQFRQQRTMLTNASA